MKVAEKTILVTGGGSGIGRQLTLLLLRKGARVAALDLNAATLQETADLAGDLRDRLSTHVANITDRAAVEALPATVVAAHGAVDGVINNAGIIQPFVKVNDLQIADMERVLQVNFWGTVNITKAFLPHLLSRPAAHIVNISSMGGFVPIPGQTIYGASKAAVKLFTEGLHSELLSTNVRVTIVLAGAVATNITTNSGVTSATAANSAQGARFKALPAPRAAEIIVAGMEQDKTRVLVGTDARTMDFLSRLMPERAAKIIYNQMRSLLPD